MDAIAARPTLGNGRSAIGGDGMSRRFELAGSIK